MLRETTMQRLQSFGWILMAAVLLCAAPAAGQFGTTGQVLGHVTDSEGAAVSGATVILQSQEIDDPLTVTTDAEGFYNATDVRPATYQISVEAAGYAAPPVSLAVRVGSRQRLNFEMAAQAEVTEEITVVSERPPIETLDSRVNKYITFEEIQNLPLPNRNFLDVLNILPGVHPGPISGSLENKGPSNSFSVHGARLNQNLFLIDGVANNDLSDLNADDLASSEARAGPRASAGGGTRSQTFQVGTALTTFNMDAIQEVQVSTSMFSAEYGNASGGVINIVTRSGADQISASATVQRQTNGLVQDGTIGAGDAAKEREPQEFIREQASVTLGGPIKRGTTHFFATYEFDDYELGYDFNLSTALVPTFLQGLGLTANSTRRDRLTGKLTHDFSDSNSLTLSSNWVDEGADVLASIFRASVDDLDPQDHANESLGMSLRHVAMVGSDMTLESVVGRTQADRSVESALAPLRQLRLGRYPDGGLEWNLKGNIGPDNESEIESLQWNERLSWLRGDHSLRAGVGVDRFSQRTQQPEFLILSYGFVPDFSVPPATGFYFLPTDLDVSVTNTHLFIQDDWFVNERWTFNLGGRYDRNNLVDDQSYEARLGAAVDTGGDGRSVFRFGAGIYHDRTNLVGHTGALRPVPYRAPIDPVTLVPDPFSGILNEAVVDPNLELPEILKWTVGYQRQIGERNTVGIHVIGSDSDGLFFEDRLNRQSVTRDGARPDPTRGQINFYTNSGSSEVLDIELEFQRRFRSGSSLRASYVKSDAKGNSVFDLISGNSVHNRHSALDEFAQPSLAYGPLNNERVHSIKVSGIGNLPWGLQLSGIANWSTGTPYTAFFALCAWVETLNRCITYPSIWPQDFNTLRLDNYFKADLSLGKVFTVRDRHKLKVFFDVFNVTERENVLEREGLLGYNNFALDPNDPRSVDTPDRFQRIRTRGSARSAQIGIRWSM